VISVVTYLYFFSLWLNKLHLFSHVILLKHSMCFSRNKDPDFVVQRAVVSMGLDILSLGTLILQVTTGKRGKHVHLWDDNDILSRYPSFDVTCIGQFKLCFETGLRCAEVGCSDTIQEIIETLKSANLGSVSNELQPHGY
jgi:hypothetical protein